MFDWLIKLSSILVFDKLGFEEGSHLGEALHFFIYDTIKIFILIIAIVYIVTLLRSYLPLDKIRDYLSGKHKFIGHIFASIFGMTTPFCSCSAIPLFVGFLQARIPLGVTFSYLISAPLGDAVVLAMMFSIFGLKITLLYIAFALTIAIVAGLIIGAMNLEKEILIEVKAIDSCCSGSKEYKQDSFKEKLFEAFEYTKDIFKKLYIYVIIGIAIGAFIHGYIPSDFIEKYAGGDVWYAPIVAVVMAVPMYSNAAGILPLVEVLTQKGVLMGTALSFMMAVVAVSLPEAMILKRVMSLKLITIFFSIVAIAIICIGYIFNYLIG
ncbi:permease [Arcobacter porcinus]|uniref:Permease n=1 Tax=Arcobacter porcinus TaxID=1935204 RepID=A0ABX2YB37_9BACT|nr:permease [Arcobacter porcinus]OCL84063.1 putative permease [Arcobacter porcinus]OCL84585.1 putative permease [Arcobacter porcinus]OCL89127.1 putative permease [Arcobacter porcinus]OCL91547.1 putative permease [Arcobacter porcinus]